MSFWNKFYEEFKSTEGPIQSYQRASAVKPILLGDVLYRQFSSGDDKEPAAQTEQQPSQPPQQVQQNIQWGHLLLDTGMLPDPIFTYAREKGFLLLSSKRRLEHGIRTLNLTLDASDSCLGSRPMQLILEAFIGYDTIILNNIVHTLGGRGYLYNQQTHDLWNLNFAGEIEQLNVEGTPSLWRI